MKLKHGLIALLCFFPFATYSQVTELNNQNATECRQALQHSGQHQQVVLMYLNGCPYAEKFRPYFEEVAEEKSNKTFFAFDFSKSSNPNVKRIAKECFGVVPKDSPSVYIFEVSGDSIRNIKSGMDGDSTKADLQEFLN